MQSTVNCVINDKPLKYLFSKYSLSDDKTYKIYACQEFDFWQIDPIPSEQYLNQLYQNEYFNKRSDRGYDDYTSENIKKSVMGTFEKNLADCNFHHWQASLPQQNKTSLDIGCAAGYFVELMQHYGFNSYGIDVAENMVAAARQRQLKVSALSFLDDQLLEKLQLNKNHQFDLITLWATIEHLPNFNLFMAKIRSLLKPHGRVYLSTCHLGFWAKLYGKNWRYLNVPEHLWYFGLSSLKYIAANAQLNVAHSFTYGSGFTQKTKPSLMFRWAKKMADTSAKFFHSGDMIVLDLRHF